MERMLRCVAISYCWAMSARLHCGNCGKPIVPDEPVWRRYLRGGYCSCCEACAGLNGEWPCRYYPAGLCANCGRRVHLSLTRGRMIYCSDVCREQVRYATARAKRAELRGTRICDNCDETFEPRRSDAKFCSRRLQATRISKACYA